jgi:hypothetical protein
LRHFNDRDDLPTEDVRPIGPVIKGFSRRLDREPARRENKARQANPGDVTERPKVQHWKWQNNVFKYIFERC